MKRASILSLFLACLAGQAAADATTIWVDGLEERDGQIVGWYDYNKQFDGDDDLLCWAATSANIISWWQDRRPDAHLAAGDPEGEDVWSTFVDSYSNNGGHAMYGLRWWITGQAPSQSGNGWAVLEDTESGGYYKSFITRSFNYEVAYNTMSRYNSMDGAATAVSEMAYYINSGYAIGLGLVSVNESDGHAITLWGMEYDPDTYELIKIYVTDSDDHAYGWENVQDGLLELECTPSTDNELGYETYTLRSVSPDGVNYWYNNDMALMDFVAFNAAMPLDLPEQTVPEPVTGALSLLGFCGGAARRRRRSA